MSENDLTPKQRKAIAALLANRTYGEAATAARIDPKTLQRWMDDPAFRAALRAAESNLVDEAGRNLVRSQLGAIAVLVSAMADKTAAWSTRIRAADLLLAHGARYRELGSIEDRLRLLEEHYATQP